MKFRTRNTKVLGGVAVTCLASLGAVALGVNAGSSGPGVGLGDNASQEILERAVDDTPAAQRKVVANHSVTESELVSTGTSFAGCVEAEFARTDAGLAGLTLDVELEPPTRFSTGVDYRISVSTPTSESGVAAHGSLLDIVPAIEDGCREKWIDNVEEVRLATLLADETLVEAAESKFLECIEDDGVVDVRRGDDVIDVMDRASDDLSAAQSAPGSRRSVGDGESTAALVSLQDCFAKYPILNEVLAPDASE